MAWSSMIWNVGPRLTSELPRGIRRHHGKDYESWTGMEAPSFRRTFASGDIVLSNVLTMRGNRRPGR